jgi:hypothetical protein
MPLVVKRAGTWHTERHIHIHIYIHVWVLYDARFRVYRRSGWCAHSTLPCVEAQVESDGKLHATGPASGIRRSLYPSRDGCPPCEEGTLGMMLCDFEAVTKSWRSRDCERPGSQTRRSIIRFQPLDRRPPLPSTSHVDAWIHPSPIPHCCPVPGPGPAHTNPRPKPVPRALDLGNPSPTVRPVDGTTKLNECEGMRRRRPRGSKIGRIVRTDKIHPPPFAQFWPMYVTCHNHQSITNLNGNPPWHSLGLDKISLCLAPL